MYPLNEKAMPTMEYLILLGMVVAAVLVGLQTAYLPPAREDANAYFKKAAIDIMGDRPDYVNFMPAISCKGKMGVDYWNCICPGGFKEGDDLNVCLKALGIIK